MSSCSQYAAAFGYQLFIVPVSACGVDVGAVAGGIKANGFIDPTSLLPANTKIEGGLDGEILSGEPGVNIVYDNSTITSETVIRLYGLTNAALETDTGSETVTTYDTESKGFDQNVAVSKSWSLSLEGVSQFTDAGYKALRLLEQNAVAGSLKVKIGRIGPTGTSEAIYGYATLTGFSESVEAGSIVSWSVTAEGFGPYAIDLDNSGTINVLGPLQALSIADDGADLADGVFASLPLDAGTGTVDVTVSGSIATAVAINGAGGEDYSVNQVVGLASPLLGVANPSAGAVTALSIANPGVDQLDGTYSHFNLSGGSGGAVGLEITAVVSGGAVTSLQIDTAGTDYVVADVLVDLEIPSAPNPNEGEILTTTLTSGGSGYLDGAYTGVSLTGGSGTSATADVVITGGVAAITMIDGGIDYIALETLSADDADLGGNGGTGLVITIDTVDENSGLGSYIPASYVVDSVEADLLTAVQPTFTVTEIQPN